MIEVPRDKLLNSHDELLFLLEQLGIKTVLYDEDSREYTLFYRNENNSPLVVTDSFSNSPEIDQSKMESNNVHVEGTSPQGNSG